MADEAGKCMCEPRSNGRVQGRPYEERSVGIVRAHFGARKIDIDSAEAHAVGEWLTTDVSDEEAKLPEEWEARLPDLIDLGLEIYRRDDVEWDSEEARISRQWVAMDILHHVSDLPNDWKARQQEAFDFGRYICREFNRPWSAFWGAGCPGEHQVRRRLHARAPELAEVDLSSLTDAIIERILNKRLHLLDAVYSKYQGSLFAERRFDSQRLPGYFSSVANIESRKVPPLPFRAESLHEYIPDKNADGDHSRLFGEEQVDQRGFLEEWKGIPVALWRFHNAHRFNEQHRLEAMVSTGLGAFIPDEHYQDVVARCREFLHVNLPFYKKGLGKLAAKASRLFAKLEQMRERLRFASDFAEAAEFWEEVERLESRLIRVEQERRQLFKLLQPKPRKAEQLLGAHVHNLGNTRHDRIRREVELLGNRVREGWQELSKGHGQAIPDIAQELMGHIEQHADHRPPSHREHHLAPEERDRRQEGEKNWLEEAKELLRKILEQFRVIDDGASSLPQGLSKDLLRWLADAEDYYELGILGNGALDGLTRRMGWRLHHLLRESLR